MTPDVVFLALLPAFVVVTLVGAIETIGDGVAIQRVSQRRPRATDFRVVQGALNADGVGNLLSGIAGTLPNTTYSTSISLAEITGIASRRVGVAIGVIIVALAFLPKVAALLMAIPAPVAAAYLAVLLGLLFVQGMRIVIQDGIDHRKAIVVGVSFWVGLGFQIQSIFPDQLGEGFFGILLGNGMTSGAIVAIIMVAFMELTAQRRRRLQVAFGMDALPKIDEFLRDFASRGKWNAASTDRLTSAGEETLAIMLQENKDDDAGMTRSLVVTARMEGRSAELEFVTAVGRGEHAGPNGILERATPCSGRARGVVPLATALRFHSAASEVSRRGCRYGKRRRAALGPAPTRPTEEVVADPGIVERTSHVTPAHRLRRRHYVPRPPSSRAIHSGSSRRPGGSSKSASSAGDGVSPPLESAGTWRRAP